MAARLTDEERRLRSITEAQFQKQVIDIATAAGWLHYHPPRAGVRANGTVRHTVAGFPDLTLVRSGRLIFMELKREKGVVLPEQAKWHERLMAAGVEVYVVRPSDLPSVRRILARSNP